MNTARNSVQLIGHLGKDVEFKTFENGGTQAIFSLATNDYYKNAKEEKIQDTQWHNIVANGKTAELMNSFLTKGSEVIVRGKITSRTYDDKEGIKRYVTEIKANEFICLDKNPTPF